MESRLPTDQALLRSVGELADRLIERGWKMATAESCTGGWIAKCCTDLAGSSEWFERGIVSYSNAAKTELLGVTPSMLNREGAVSEAVAIQMAAGARQRSGADVALAVTGIAGPDGGTRDKPVGTVWFAWALDNTAAAELRRFEGDREAVRRQTVQFALEGLMQRL